jgi:hypothetical protein
MKFHVEELTVVETEIPVTTFLLDGFKEDPRGACNRIQFKGSGGRELKELLKSLFLNNHPFDFRIKDVVGKGTCTIDTIISVRGAGG